MEEVEGQKVTEGDPGALCQPVPVRVNRGYKGDTSLKKFNGHPHLDTFLPLLDCTGPLQSRVQVSPRLLSLPEPQRTCST